MPEPTSAAPLPTATIVKPGWKTTEYWLTKITMTIGALLAIGFFGDGTRAERIAGAAMIVLAQFGYTYSRGMVKAAAALLFVFVVGSAPTACAWVKSEAKQVAHDVENCTTSAARDAISQFAPTVDALLAQSSTDDGKINWAPVKDLAKGFKSELGGCVLASVVTRALKHAPAAPDSPRSSQLELDDVSLRSGFEELRREQFGGRTFHTDDGDL